MAIDSGFDSDPAFNAGQNDESWAPDAVDLVVETESVMSILAAQQYARIDVMRREMLASAAADGCVLTDVTERSVRLELAAALRVTEAAAGRLIAEADALVHRYPRVLDSLGGAKMTRRHATILVDALDGVEPEFTAQVLAGGIGLAESLPVGSFRRQLHDLVESVRVVTLSQRYQDAVLTRRISVEQAADGMGWLHTFGPMVEILAIHGRLTATAKVLLAGDPDDDRTLDQARADVFADLLIDGTTDTLPAEVRGIRPTVAVAVPVLTLLDGDDGVGDAKGGMGAARGFASVEGIGPIPIEQAKELCGSSDGWMRVLTHPETGVVLSVGRDHYRPPPGLRRLVRWRAETCMAPGCTIPASRCQIDHNIDWAHGGTTSLWNLAPFCQGHHTVKHHGRWRVEQVPDTGAILWTSPTGRHYRVSPARAVPVFTPTGPEPPATAPF